MVGIQSRFIDRKSHGRRSGRSWYPTTSDRLGSNLSVLESRARQHPISVDRVSRSGSRELHRATQRKTHSGFSDYSQCASGDLRCSELGRFSFARSDRGTCQWQHAKRIATGCTRPGISWSIDLRPRLWRSEKGFGQPRSPKNCRGPPAADSPTGRLSQGPLGHRIDRGKLGTPLLRGCRRDHPVVAFCRFRVAICDRERSEPTVSKRQCPIERIGGIHQSVAAQRPSHLTPGPAEDPRCRDARCQPDSNQSESRFLA